MLARYVAVRRNRLSVVDDIVGLAPSSHGTTSPLAGPAGGFGCTACAEQQAGSAFMRKVNQPPPEAPGPAWYTVVTTTHDEVVTPYRSQALAGDRATNVILQDKCPSDPFEHVTIVGDPVAIQWTVNALERPGAANPRFVPDCTGDLRPRPRRPEPEPALGTPPAADAAERHARAPCPAVKRRRAGIRLAARARRRGLRRPARAARTRPAPYGATGFRLPHRHDAHRAGPPQPRRRPQPRAPRPPRGARPRAAPAARRRRRRQRAPLPLALSLRAREDRAMYDYVIVGAGSAGCVLANRLSEDPDVSVCLVEAGPPDTEEGLHIPVAFSQLYKTPFDWDFASEPEAALDGRSVYLPRGRVLGGSSSLNAMIYIRGNRRDYDEWRDLGNAGWGWDDVLPYFMRAEDNERGASEFHGAGGPLSVSDSHSMHPLADAFVEAGRQAGLEVRDDFNTGEQDGVGRYQLTQRNGMRCSTAVAYLHPVLTRPNVTLIPMALVTRVLFDGSRASRCGGRGRGRGRPRSRPSAR